MPLVIGSYPITPYGCAHTSLSLAKTDGLSYILLDLEYKGPRGDLKALTSNEWGNSIVGVLSNFTVDSSTVDSSSNNSSSSKTLDAEIEWAMHMGIPAIIFPPCPMMHEEEKHANFNRMLHAAALKVSGSR